MVKVGIIGATGYAGNELVRLLMGHKDVEIKWYGSRSYIDQKYASVYQNMFKLVDAECMDDNMKELAEQLGEYISAPIYKTYIRSAVVVEEAQANSQDIFDYANKSTVAEDYKAFIDEFLKGVNE